MAREKQAQQYIYIYINQQEKRTKRKDNAKKTVGLSQQTRKGHSNKRKQTISRTYHQGTQGKGESEKREQNHARKKSAKKINAKRREKRKEQEARRDIEKDKEAPGNNYNQTATQINDK